MALVPASCKDQSLLKWEIAIAQLLPLLLWAPVAPRKAALGGTGTTSAPSRSAAVLQKLLCIPTLGSTQQLAQKHCTLKRMTLSHHLLTPTFKTSPGIHHWPAADKRLQESPIPMLTPA